MKLWEISIVLLVIGVVLILIVKIIIRNKKKVKGFNYNHPEKREDEIFLTNGCTYDHLFEDDFSYDTFSSIGWKTKRMGKQAYDKDGNLIADAYPIFIKKSEVEADGHDVKKFQDELRRRSQVKNSKRASVLFNRFLIKLTLGAGKNRKRLMLCSKNMVSTLSHS